MRSLTLRPPVSYTGSRDPGRGIGWSKSQRKKARSCAVAHAPAARILYGRLHRPKTSHFLWIQREKVWSCPMRQDRAVHRRSEACMAGAQLASFPWLTVDSFGCPPPLGGMYGRCSTGLVPVAYGGLIRLSTAISTTFSLWIFVNTC